MSAFNRSKKIWITVGAVLLAFILAVSVLLLTNTLQFWIIRLMCGDKPGSFPENYDSVISSTSSETVEYISGLEMEIYTPVNFSDNMPLVLYFHGGYYVGGGKGETEPYCRKLASNGFIVANANYSLAPEKVYPTQLNEAVKALRYVTEKFPDSVSVSVAGDSAGAHLASQLAALSASAALRSAAGIGDVAEIDGVVANCGYFDANTIDKSGFFLIGSSIKMLMGDANYKQNPKTEELNVIKYVSAYPPILIVCGDKDPFIKQNKQMYDAVLAANRRAESYFPVSDKNALGHEFQMNYNLAESYTAMEKTVAFLKSLSA